MIIANRRAGWNALDFLKSVFNLAEATSETLEALS